MNIIKVEVDQKEERMSCGGKIMWYSITFHVQVGPVVVPVKYGHYELEALEKEVFEKAAAIMQETNFSPLIKEHATKRN